MSRGYFQHGGVTFPGLLYSPRGLEAAREFPVEDDDIYNVTYQKSGTVWMLEILSLIRQDGDPNWCRSVPNWDRGPWLETLLGYRRARGNARPRIISSHLPVQMFPKAFFGSKAKVIYTVRDPKDVLVSLFHFARIFRPYKDPGTLGEFMEKFLQGDVPFGSWFQHVRGWLQLRGRENFFWISYEELQQDLRGSVQRLCEFLGRPLSPAQLDAVVANASFVTMSHNPMSNFSLSPRFILDRRRGPFLRKGISGDWRNHLSPEQSRRFDLVYREQMEGLGVSFPWDPPEKSPETPPKLPPKSPKSPPKSPGGGDHGETQKWEEMTQKMAQDEPKTPEIPPKSTPESPGGCEHVETQKWEEMTQKVGEMTQKVAQDEPKTPEIPPKSALKSPKSPPKSAGGGDHGETQKWEEMTQKVAQDEPKTPEIPPKSTPESPGEHGDTQKEGKMPQKGGEMPQKLAQDPPKTTQDEPKTSQDPPKILQNPPKPPQNFPKTALDASRTTQDPPKTPQDLPETP